MRRSIGPWMCQCGQIESARIFFSLTQRADRQPAQRCHPPLRTAPVPRGLNGRWLPASLFPSHKQVLTYMLTSPGQLQVTIRRLMTPHNTPESLVLGQAAAPEIHLTLDSGSPQTMLLSSGTDGDPANDHRLIPRMQRPRSTSFARHPLCGMYQTLCAKSAMCTLWLAGKVQTSRKEERELRSETCDCGDVG